MIVKQKRFPHRVQVRVSDEMLHEMDNLIAEGKFDDYPSIMRRALNEFINSQKRTIVA